MLNKEVNLISAASIIRATSNGDADAVRVLLADGADVNERGRGGHTALMVAAIFSHVDIASILLAAGADVQLLDNLGLTARDWANRRGSWEVAQLLANASPAETGPAPRKPRTELRLDAERWNPAAEPGTNPGHDAFTGTEEQGGKQSHLQHREVDEWGRVRATEPKVAPEPDALRFMKFHKQIMAAQERRKAEQSRREVEDTLRSSPIETNETNIPLDTPSASPWSEQHAVATGPSTIATQPETEIHTLPIAADAPRQNDPEGARLAATQLAKIAATIKQLTTVEESGQRVDGNDTEKSDWTMPAGVERGPDPDEHDATLERPRAEISTRPSMPAPKISEAFDPPAIKRCPKCNAAYDNPILLYCAYDATKLTSADDAMFGYSAPKDRSRQTLWVLVIIVTVLGASLGYLVNNYRSRSILTSAPVASIVNPPIATQTEPLAKVANDSPLLSAELNGMELEVPEPEYPVNLRADGVSETITVRVQVNKNGRVVSARSSNGDWRLRAAAVKAAQRTTFSAEKLAVRGKAVSGSIIYTFVAPAESSAMPASPTATQTNSPTTEASATGTSVAEVGGDYPVVGGPLVGAENKVPQPEYPVKAKSRGISGTITVVVRVNRAGNVISWRTLEGDSQLRAAALKAAKRATFSPAKLPGKGEVVGSITYTFK